MMLVTTIIRSYFSRAIIYRRYVIRNHKRFFESTSSCIPSHREYSTNTVAKPDDKDSRSAMSNINSANKYVESCSSTSACKNFSKEDRIIINKNSLVEDDRNLNCLQKNNEFKQTQHKIHYHKDNSNSRNETNGPNLSILTSNQISKTSDTIKFRTYEDVIKDINTLQSNAEAIAAAGVDPSERMPLFMEHVKLAGISLEDIDSLNIIHVSGTKGKGSTCAFVESILRANNYRTGFFNSPHLVRYTERIRLDGEPITDNKFIMYFSEVFDRLKRRTEETGLRMPAFFAFMTILAFHTFIREKIQVAIMEVGIGGILDTTNIVNRPVVCGITSLDYDHVTILGNSIESIAKHKAGIIKRQIPVFTVPDQPEEALVVIKAQADFLESPYVLCPPIESYNLKLGIEGQAQALNASLAIQLSRAWLASQSKHYSDMDLNDATVRGLQDCRWPGRCQIVNRNNITYYLDGAHTRNSLINGKEWFKCSSFKALLDQKNIVRYLILNITGDRSRESLMQQLIDLNFDVAIFTKNKVINNTVNTKMASNNNAEIWRCLMKSVDHEYGKNHIVVETQCTMDALDYIYKESSSNPTQISHVLVTGSLHLVGAVFEALDIMDKEMV